MDCCEWKQRYQDLQMVSFNDGVERGKLKREVTHLEINNKYLETHTNMLRKIIADLREIINPRSERA